MKVVFMGTPEFAIPCLEVLLNSHHSVVAIVTATDKPSGRGRKLRPSPVKKYALANDLLILQPRNLKDPKFIKQLQALNADLYVVVGFRILPPIVFMIPPKGTINVHASLLPQYRGAAPINWAIINGETKTGVTIFIIDEKVDTGQFIFQEEIQIQADENAGDIHDQLMHLGAKLLLEAIELIEVGMAQPREQIGEVSLAPKIKREHCHIDWSKDAQTIHNLVRGLSPYPTAFSILDGKVVKILKTKAIQRKASSNFKSGEICFLNYKAGIIRVATGAGFIEILELQLEGRRRMTSSEFLRGHTLEKHQQFE